LSCKPQRKHPHGRGNLKCQLCAEPKQSLRTLYCDGCAAGKAAEMHRRHAAKPETQARLKAKAARWNSDKQGRYSDYLRRTYGISLQQMQQRLALQGGCCEICAKPIFIRAGASGISRADRCCVDHDHKTGRLRALLCSSCNGGLGLFKDSGAALLSAVRYLRWYGVGQ
jgi:hypothetical protein